MDISIFLAKLIGVYLLIVTFLCVFRKRQVELTGKEVLSSRSSLAISAEFSLIFGLVIALDHSVWGYSWRGLITLIGYLMIVRGVMRFAFPAEVRKLGTKMLTKFFWPVCVVTLAVGIFLTYRGFTFVPMTMTMTTQ